MRITGSVARLMPSTSAAVLVFALCAPAADAQVPRSDTAQRARPLGAIIDSTRPSRLRTPATPVEAAARPPASPADVGSVDAILKAVYDVISGPAGKKRDADRFRSLFVPGARLIPTGPRRPPAGSAEAGGSGGANARMLDVEEYIQRAFPRMEQDGFFERELSRKVDAFGNIAHAFSTYESLRALSDAKPFARGINSIQLLKDGNRWWIVNIYWDSERPDNPIPATYLPKGES